MVRVLLRLLNIANGMIKMLVYYGFLLYRLL